MPENAFDVLLLIARPGAGKSEVIDYIKRTPLDQRLVRFKIGELEEIDDFPMLWTWFEEDHILNELGHPRLYTDEHQHFKYDYLWDLLIRRICLDYDKKLRDPDYHQRYTSIIEFSRGSQHGGFQRAFEHLSSQVVARMAVLYLQVSWEESLRKNRARFTPDQPDSILGHSLPDDKLEALYRETDWPALSASHPQFLTIQGVQVPYVVFDNEDDVTTSHGEHLGQRLEDTLQRLWALYTPGRT